jgi:DNA-binding response OmpR family regulator
MINVIFIDDEKHIAELAGEFLLMEGDIAVDTVCYPQEALDRCCRADSRYDVIISDYQMPGMNGIQLLKRLRARDILSPFILFTGRGREEIVIEALNSGADLYIQKGGDPIAQFGELANSVRQLYKRKTAERELLRKSEELAILFDASTYLVGETEVGRIYEVISEATLKLMKADHLVVSSFDEEEKMIHCAFCWDKGTRVDVSNFPPLPLEDEGRGIQSQAIRSGRSLLIDDYQELLQRTASSFYFDEGGKIFTREEQEQDPEEEVTRSSLVVPLKYRGRVIGVIQVLSDQLAHFTDHDLKLVESLAGHAASAIAVARHQEAELEEARRREATERRLQILEAALDSSDEMIVVWRVQPAAIHCLCCNRKVAGTILDAEGLNHMDLDSVLRDSTGGSLDSTFRGALRGNTPVMHQRGLMRMKNESWMPLEFHIHATGGEAIVIRSRR